MNNAEVISFQLYSLRNYHALPEQLQLLSDIGFRQVETTRRNYADAAATRRLLERHGMRAPSGHFMEHDLLTRADWAIDVAHTIGIDQVVVPGPFDEEKSFGIDAWRAKGRELGGIAAKLAQSGLRTAFHNHDGEFVIMPDGRTGLDHLFDGADNVDGADAAPLYWQADLGWMARAGVDPALWLDRHRGRVVSCHVKDVAPVGQALDEDGWADVGHGILDWTRLWSAARAAGAQWMIVEHDEPQRFEEFPRRSFDFLASLVV